MPEQLLNDPQIGLDQLSHDDFRDGVRAWQLCRAGEADPADHGIGELWGWDELRGSLEVPNINGQPAFDSAIVGCRLSATGNLCNTSQAEFVNTNGPDFRPTSGSTFVQKRVRDGFTCGEVRGMYPALPPAP